ncbi:MAG: aspartate racemase, partial [Zetaproteobacteria bacterium]|nr:aspartate racemase [Pseudobdellovibrionaceae bacterium]
TLPFYRERLQDHGLEVVVPELVDIEVVNRIIYEELVEGVITESSRQIYLDIIKKYEETADVQGVIAGCTEIPLLIQQIHCSLPVIDSTLAHSQMAVQWFTAAS